MSDKIMFTAPITGMFKFIREEFSDGSFQGKQEWQEELDVIKCDKCGDYYPKFNNDTKCEVCDE